MDLQEIWKTLKWTASKNSPTILTGMAVAGLITTTILAVKATPKALTLMYQEEEIRREESDDGDFDNLTKIDVIRLTWRCYIPALAVGGATILCVIGSNSISLRRNAALASVYSITETAFKEYKSKVVETIGKNKELSIRDEVTSDRIKKHPSATSEVIFTGKGDVLCYDPLSGRYFKNDIEKIRRAINDINHNLRSEMFLTVNDLYDAIGLTNTKLGYDLGWDVDTGLDVTFSSQLTEDGTPCLVLNYDVMPKFS